LILLCPEKEFNAESNLKNKIKYLHFFLFLKKHIRCNFNEAIYFMKTDKNEKEIII
jgi:hypothetical protein